MEDEEALVHLQEELVKSIQRFRSLQQNYPSISLESLNTGVRLWCQYTGIGKV